MVENSAEFKEKPIHDGISPITVFEGDEDEYYPGARNKSKIYQYIDVRRRILWSGKAK